MQCLSIINESLLTVAFAPVTKNHQTIVLHQYRPAILHLFSYSYIGEKTVGYYGSLTDFSAILISSLASNTTVVILIHKADAVLLFVNRG